MKSTKTRRKRGILLILTLVIVAVTMMFLGAGLTLSQSTGALAGSSEDQQLALEGAQAGVTYARSRLQENPSWRGGTSDKVVVNMPGQLWVRENRGNVLGIVGQGDRKCAFRIRFNYQDGNGPGGDGLNDPVSGMRFDNVYVSENNLDSASLKRVYRADQSGWSVNKASSFSPYDCVRYSATVLSEGLAGDGLRELSPTNLTPALGNRRTTRRVAEVVMGRNLSQMGDSPIYGAKDINMNVKDAGTVMVRSADSGVPPRARTLQDIYIQDANASTTPDLDMTNKGEAFVRDGNGVMKVDGVSSSKAKQEDSPFPRVNWSQITKAAPSSTNLAAGTYVWRHGPRQLDYYPQTFNPVAGPPARGSVPGPTATYDDASPLAPGAITMDTDQLELKITQDIYVNPVGAVKGIAIVPETNLVAEIKNRPNVVMAAAGPTSPAPVITSQGDIFVRGSLNGEGSVTTEGNITFQGTSVLEADQNSRTAIYAKGDVTLEEMPPEIAAAGATITGSGKKGGSGGKVPSVAFLSSLPLMPFGAPSFRDIAFSGLFYTQGSIKANFPNSDADLYFRGMVVAFGADPESGANPGTAGTGKIDFTGGNVYLEYDSRYVVGPLNLQGPAKLELTSYNVL